jgi:hypothetical protein
MSITKEVQARIIVSNNKKERRIATDTTRRSKAWGQVISTGLFTLLSY